MLSIYRRALWLSLQNTMKTEIEKITAKYAPMTLAVLTGTDFAKLLSNDAFFLMMNVVQATIKFQQRKTGKNSRDTEASVMFILGYLAAKQDWWDEQV